LLKRYESNYGAKNSVSNEFFINIGFIKINIDLGQTEPKEACQVSITFVFYTVKILTTWHKKMKVEKRL